MPFELQTVVWTTVILLCLLVFQGSLMPLTQGLKWGLGSRDSQRDTSVMQGRASRTVANHIEGMALFVPLALVIVVADVSSHLTVIGASLYIAGRLAYAPLYLGGVPYVRSLAWGVSALGILLVGFETLRAAI